jgi:hypothetical protein
MAEEDKPHTNFITPFGIYCFTWFRLWNMAAIIARLILKVSKVHIGRNVEAYGDDIMLCSRKA